MRRQLLRLCRSQSLPTLTQGSTLTIRSTVPSSNILITSEWRDNGKVSLYQRLRQPQQQGDKLKDVRRPHHDHNNNNTSMIVTQEKDKVTSLLGRPESHVSIQIRNGSDGDCGSDENPDKQHTYFEEDGKHRSFISSLLSSSCDKDTTLLDINVPEKVNLDCNLYEGGSIFIQNKIEGDVRLKTSNGVIHVQKLRGHDISIEADTIVHKRETRQRNTTTNSTNSNESYNNNFNEATIFASELLEATTLHLKTTTTKLASILDQTSTRSLESGRIRVKRIHAKTVNVNINSITSDVAIDVANEDRSNNETQDSIERMDDYTDADDSGSLCDISSLYVSGLATIQVNSDTPPSSGSAVRIKSNHGTVVVNSTTPKPEAKMHNMMSSDGADESIVAPIVDLGGVNGSCEVFVHDTAKKDSNSSATIANEGSTKDWNSCRVHFDSIEPDSVSLVQVGIGNVSITVDRKVESDLRLVSASNAESLDMDVFVADGGDSDSSDDDAVKYDSNDSLLRALDALDASSTRNGNQGIVVQTNSFTKRSYIDDEENSDDEYDTERWSNINYVEGWIENKSGEPDSRFDRKLRGNNSIAGSGGKIRIEGAAAQALHGFSQNSRQNPIGGNSAVTGTETMSTSFPRPLVVVASSGQIVLETLSWLGNIARRFGMEEKREKSDIGRTATRRGRELVTPVDNE